MKQRLLTGALMVAFATLAMPAQAQEQDFDSGLSPYGEWVEVPQLGRVWRPAQQVVGADFEPYSTGGHWVSSDEGWIFESDYPFSWAVYHYGRWYQDPSLGWVWVRGNEWAPSWVDWRSGGGYVGWVPMAPVNIEVVYPAYRPRYAFVETRYLVDPNPWRHRVDQGRYEQAYHAAAPVERERNRGYGMGPPPTHIASAAGVAIRPVHVVPPPPGVVQRVSIGGPGRATTMAAPAPSVGGAPAPGRGGGRMENHEGTPAPGRVENREGVPAPGRMSSSPPPNRGENHETAPSPNRNENRGPMAPPPPSRNENRGAVAAPPPSMNQAPPPARNEYRGAVNAPERQVAPPAPQREMAPAVGGRGPSAPAPAPRPMSAPPPAAAPRPAAPPPAAHGPGGAPPPPRH